MFHVELVPLGGYFWPSEVRFRCILALSSDWSYNGHFWKFGMSGHFREEGFKLSLCLLIGTLLPASYSLELHLARPLYSWNLKARNLWNLIFQQYLFNAFLLEYKLNFLHHSVHCFMFCDTTEVSEVSSKGEVLNYGKHTHMRAKWDPYHIRLPQFQLKHISQLFLG